MCIFEYDNGDSIFSINAFLIFIIITILLLTFFGVNIFFVIGDIFETIYSFIVPFILYILSFVTYFTGWIIYETTDVAKNVSQGGIEIVGDGIEEVGIVLMNAGDYIDKELETKHVETDKHDHDHSDSVHAERIKDHRDHSDSVHAERIKDKLDKKRTNPDLEKFFTRPMKEKFSNYTSDNISDIIQNPIQNKKNTLFKANYVNIDDSNKPITCKQYPNQASCLN